MSIPSSIDQIPLIPKVFETNSYKILYDHLRFINLRKKSEIMEVTTYSKFRENMKSYLDNVVNDSRPLHVTRTNGEDVVVLSKSDYESMQETN